MDIVAALLKSGAEVGATDGYGSNALHAAAMGGRDAPLALLLHYAPWRWVVSQPPPYRATLDATAGDDAMTPLHCAVLSAGPARLECARLLLRAGADTEIKNKKGQTAEELAVDKGLAALIALLREPPPTHSQALGRARQRLAFACGLHSHAISHDLVELICGLLPAPTKIVAVAIAIAAADEIEEKIEQGLDTEDMEGMEDMEAQ